MNPVIKVYRTVSAMPEDDSGNKKVVRCKYSRVFVRVARRRAFLDGVGSVLDLGGTGSNINRIAGVASNHARSLTFQRDSHELGLDFKRAFSVCDEEEFGLK